MDLKSLFRFYIVSLTVSALAADSGTGAEAENSRLSNEIAGEISAFSPGPDEKELQEELFHNTITIPEAKR